MRPAGGGVYLVSTGRREQVALQQAVYGAATETAVDAAWRADLERIKDARVALLAVPSDVGAGFLRGANMGPAALRDAMLAAHPNLRERSRAARVVDVGDVFVVPQLLHDEMLSQAQLERSRVALYPGVAEGARALLPVAPLSMAERVIDLLFTLNAGLRLMVFGGDHSVAWPVASALARRDRRGLAIVQFDAHTDLLEERLGVPYCFATWSRHAARLLERPDRMVQVGIRATRHERSHWERETGVVQVWADECRRDGALAAQRIVEALAASGATRVYISNDIDGTDEAFADATGTPEPDGLAPEFVVDVIRKIGERFEVVAGDVMEVAPPLERTPGGRARTLATAMRYIDATLEGLLRAP